MVSIVGSLSVAIYVYTTLYEHKLRDDIRDLLPSLKANWFGPLACPALLLASFLYSKFFTTTGSHVEAFFGMAFIFTAMMIGLVAVGTFIWCCKHYVDDTLTRQEKAQTKTDEEQLGGQDKRKRKSKQPPAKPGQCHTSSIRKNYGGQNSQSHRKNGTPPKRSMNVGASPRSPSGNYSKSMPLENVLKIIFLLCCSSAMVLSVFLFDWISSVLVMATIVCVASVLISLAFYTMVVDRKGKNDQVNNALIDWQLSKLHDLRQKFSSVVNLATFFNCIWRVIVLSALYLSLTFLVKIKTCQWDWTWFMETLLSLGFLGMLTWQFILIFGRFLMDNGYLTRSCKESERFRANRRSERAKKQADDSFLKKTFFLFEDQLVQTIMRR